MASDSQQLRTPAAGATLVEYEQFIEAQLRKTRSHVRSVDLAGTLMTMAAGTLTYFLIAAIVDHWVVSRGLGFWGRLLLLVLYLGGLGVYLARNVIPLLLRRINPLYAAQTIERSRPSLKNAVINFLMFRADQRGLPRMVYEAIEEQAALNLAKVNVEAAVDRSNLILLGYALVAILVTCALYTLLSPKDLFRSVGRVAMPWAAIDPATRTSVTEIEPGNAEAFRGQQVTVKARVEGLPSGGPVRLLYTTDDQQTVDRPVEMMLAPGGYKHECTLPPGESTLQQSLHYRIEAGDAVTRDFRLEVNAAPAIAVRSVEYKYPAYSGLLPQTVADQGDIKALEGTLVTIHAVANEEIQSAYLDFNGDNHHDLSMEADGQRAKVFFTAALKSDRSGPEYESYQLLFKNIQGQLNPQPVRHQIEVTRDLPPEIQFVTPKEDEIEVPLNGSAELEVIANDPDFALANVKLVLNSGAKPAAEVTLLDEVWRGQWVKKYRLEPGKLKLAVGDTLSYRAVALDNKTPEANRVETAARRIRVVAADKRQGGKSDKSDRGQQKGAEGERGERAGTDQPERSEKGDAAEKAENRPQDAKQEKQDGAQGQKGQDIQAAEDAKPEGNEGQADKREGQSGEKGSAGTEQGAKSGERGDKSGESSESSAGSGESAEDRRVPSDGSDDRDAFERILEHDKQSDPNNKGAEGEASEQAGGEGQGQQSGGQGNKSQGSEKSGDQPEQSQGPGKPGDQGKQGASKSDQHSQKQGDKQSAGESGQPSSERNASSGKQQGERGKSPSEAEAGRDQNKPDPSSKDRAEGSRDTHGENSDKQKQDETLRGDPSGQQQKGTGAQDKKGDRPDPSQKQKSDPGDSDAAGEQSGDQSGAGGQRSSGKQGQQSGKGAKESSGGNDQPGADKVPNEGGQKSEQSGKQGSQPSDQKQGQQAGQQSSERGTDEKSADKQGSKQESAKPEAGERGDEQGQRGQNAPSADKKGDQGARKKSNSAGEASGKGDSQQGGGSQQQKKEDKQPGAGRSPQASPDPQGLNKPRSGSDEKSDAGGEQKENAPQSPSISDRQSKSKGADDGDRSGGGKQGGGQKSRRSGAGEAGQNSPADEGAGRANEPGQGEDSAENGGSRESKEKTGTSGTNRGDGSKSAPSSGNQDQQGQGEPDQNQNPSGQPQNDSQARPGDNVRSGAPGSQQSNSPGGQRPPASGQDGPRGSGDSGAEKANLDYARKATDLALRHLKDELKKDKPDPELLKQLGWTKSDLENFVRRWEQMRSQSQAAGEKGVAARRELDDALRSLGLRPRGTSIKGNAARSDNQSGYRESRRTAPPPEYEEQYKAYTQGTAKGGR